MVVTETGILEADPILVEGNDKQRQPTELAIVIPTFNERDNVTQLLEGLEITLKGIAWEAIFVDDDSPDGTADLVRRIAQQKQQVRVIQRIGRRGLASACVEGVLSSSAPYFAVIDGDLQHDETLLPQMLEELKARRLDIVIASRYVVGGSIPNWKKTRRAMSRVSSLAARLIIGADLKDPMSGFFVMRRRAFDETVRNLSQHGFKILFDLFASAPRPFRYAELPYQFRERNRGQSKLDGMAVWEFGILLADKLLGRFIPPRLALFGLVGAFGLAIHLAVLSLGLLAGFSFLYAQTIAVLTAMTTNFTLNNLVTYRDRQLKGWAFARGLLSFYVICSLGAIANVGIGTVIYTQEPIWWLAGIAGAIVGTVWNYTVSAFFTWNRA